MHSGSAGQAARGHLQRLHTPIGRVVHVDVESRLVKLDDVHAVGLQRQRFLVQQLGKGHGHLDLVAIKAVGHGVHNGHGARQGKFEFFLRVGAGQLGFEGVHTAFQAQRRDDLRHLRVVAVVADAHGDLVHKVNALDLLDKAVHKVLAGLFAITDDVKARVFLGLDPQQRGIGLGLLQLGALGGPLGPEFFGLGQPRGLGQTAGDGGGEHDRVSV